MYRLGILLALSGCFTPEFSDHPKCGAGEACPEGTACSLEGICEFVNCVVNGDPCATRVVAQGVCFEGSCREIGCRDGVIEGDEECDDGNGIAGDTCDPECRAEVCGNHRQDLGEQCDDEHRELSHDGCSSICDKELEDWTELHATSLVDHQRHVAAFDEERGVLIVNDGSATWEWSGVGWRERDPVQKPQLLGRAGMAYDGALHRVVLFGTDTWSWRGDEWERVSVQNPPPTTSDLPLIYDSIRDRVVLHDLVTWEFDGVDWKTVATAEPFTRGRAGAFDLAHGVTLIFDGHATWAWNGTTWSARPDAPFEVVEATYDRVRSKVVAVDASGAVAEFDGSWSAQPAIGASPRALGYDTRRSTLVALTSTNGAISVFERPSTSTTWTDVSPRPFSGALRGSYDPDRGRIVATSQLGDAIDTWEYDGYTWMRAATTAPSVAGAMVYVPERHATILVGGYRNGTTITHVDGTFAWDGTAWSPLAITSPSKRSWSAIAYDEKRARAVMHGGALASDGSPTPETWRFDAGGWTRMPDGPPNMFGAMVYDPHHDRIVLVGGVRDLSTKMIEPSTWVLDASGWRELAAAGPSPRYHVQLAYDANRRVIVLHGGLEGFLPTSATLGDTWYLDGETWTPGLSIASGHKRMAAVAVYDPIHSRVVIGGGALETDELLADTWFLSLASTRFEKCRVDYVIEDFDVDGLVGCADPDCWGRCTPYCPPGPACDPSRPHCGDGACNRDLEDRLCPEDCP